MIDDRASLACPSPAATGATTVASPVQATNDDSQHDLRQPEWHPLRPQGGFFDWLGTQRADVIRVQELKAQPADMTAEFKATRTATTAISTMPRKRVIRGTGVDSKIAHRTP